MPILARFGPNLAFNAFSDWFRYFKVTIFKSNHIQLPTTDHLNHVIRDRLLSHITTTTYSDWVHWMHNYCLPHLYYFSSELIYVSVLNHTHDNSSRRSSPFISMFILLCVVFARRLRAPLFHTSPYSFISVSNHEPLGFLPSNILSYLLGYL